MMNHIKFKFYEHKYEECRIIDVIENIISFPFYTHNEGIKIGLSHSMSSSSLSSLSNLNTNLVSSSGISTPKVHLHITRQILFKNKVCLTCFVSLHIILRDLIALIYLLKNIAKTMRYVNTHFI